jgi:hypothetical protein
LGTDDGSALRSLGEAGLAAESLDRQSTLISADLEFRRPISVALTKATEHDQEVTGKDLGIWSRIDFNSEIQFDH